MDPWSPSKAAVEPLPGPWRAVLRQRAGGRASVHEFAVLSPSQALARSLRRVSSAPSCPRPSPLLLPEDCEPSGGACGSGSGGIEGGGEGEASRPDTRADERPAAVAVGPAWLPPVEEFVPYTELSVDTCGLPSRGGRQPSRGVDSPPRRPRASLPEQHRGSQAVPGWLREAAYCQAPAPPPAPPPEEPSTVVLASADAHEKDSSGLTKQRLEKAEDLDRIRAELEEARAAERRARQDAEVLREQLAAAMARASARRLDGEGEAVDDPQPCAEDTVGPSADPPRPLGGGGGGLGTDDTAAEALLEQAPEQYMEMLAGLFDGV
mmetsp:Transcript_11652/g.41609  ORF Transcript_11652/g.41609 Transcript_11652/m.41609 type:complete len:322 (-) Transcript_11652:52-1017(-)